MDEMSDNERALRAYPSWITTPDGRRVIVKDHLEHSRVTGKEFNRFKEEVLPPPPPEPELPKPKRNMPPSREGVTGMVPLTPEQEAKAAEAFDKLVKEGEGFLAKEDADKLVQPELPQKPPSKRILFQRKPRYEREALESEL